MATKSKSKSKQEEALQFLDDLDSLSPPAPPTLAAAPPRPSNEGEAAEVLAFLDEITQKSSEPTRTTASLIEHPISRTGTPSLRKSTERVRVGTPSPLLPSSSTASLASRTEGKTKHEKPQPEEPASAASAAWGWGSVWSTASAAIQQAKSAVDEQVKNLPKNEQARKWGEGVIEYAKTAQLDKLGQDFKRVGLSTLTDILNVVAPPISEHEVIQVWLSHDMKGYDGVETLVYRALARIMEQVEGGDLIVNRGQESRPKEANSEQRDLNAVEGYDAAFKLAQAHIDEIINTNTRPPAEPSSVQNPTTFSYVYLRVQPFIVPLSPEYPSQSTSAHDDNAQQSNLQFVLHLSDPAHNLVHTTVTQAIPAKWLEIWDQFDWVEDLVAEALRVGVEVIGQEYVVARMGWGKKARGVEIESVSKENAEVVTEKTAT